MVYKGIKVFVHDLKIKNKNVNMKYEIVNLPYPISNYLKIDLRTSKLSNR